MFLEIRFPEDISYGALGGPSFNTNITSCSNGYEERLINWIEPISCYNISHCTKEKSQIEQIISFFYITKGKAYGFRFKDWIDYKIKKQVIEKMNTQNDIIYIYKEYQYNKQIFRRRITKIVPNTEIIYINNLVLDKQDYELNYNTGALTTNKTGTIEIECEFDIPVRFDSDILKILLESQYLYSAKNIILKELIS